MPRPGGRPTARCLATACPPAPRPARAAARRPRVTRRPRAPGHRVRGRLAVGEHEHEPGRSGVAPPSLPIKRRPRGHVGSAAQQIGDPPQTLGSIAEDPLQHGGRAALPSREDRLPTGDLPSGRDSGHDDLRVETAEGSGHDLSRYLAHTRSATGEVGLQLGGPLRPGRPGCLRTPERCMPRAPPGRSTPPPRPAQPRSAADGPSPGNRCSSDVLHSRYRRLSRPRRCRNRFSSGESSSRETGSQRERITGQRSSPLREKHRRAGHKS
jgi:hypothetical protein